MDDLNFLEVTLYSIGYEIVFDKNQIQWAVFYLDKNKPQQLGRGFSSIKDAIFFACDDAALFLAVTGKLSFRIWKGLTPRRKADFLNLMQGGDAFGPGSGPAGRTPCGVSSGEAA